MAFGRGAKLEVVVAGDTRQLDRALTRTESRLKKFGKNVNKVGATSGLGSSGTLGLATKGGGAIAGVAALGLGLRKMQQAAAESAMVLGQTGVAVRQAGIDWNSSAASVEAGANRISKASSFDDEDVLKSFQVFVRGQKDVAKSLELAALAADVARGRYTDLESATQLVNKAAMGQVGALRRAGIQIDANATSTEALAKLQQTYAGAAAEYSQSAMGSSDRLRVSWENLLETLGSNTSNQVGQTQSALAGVVEWLDKTAQKNNEVQLSWQRMLGTMSTAPDITGFANAFNNAFGIPALIAGGKTGAGAPGKSNTPADPAGPNTDVPWNLANAELDARISGNKTDLKAALAKEAAWLERDILNTLPQDQGPLKQALLRVTEEIRQMDEEMIQAANNKKTAAAQARQATRAASEKALQGFKDLASDIKSAALNTFDTKTDKISNSRALATAKKALAQARQLGGPESIRLAEQGVFDANRTIERQALADKAFRVTAGPKGPVDALTVGNVTININSNQDPDVIAQKVLAALRKQSKQTAGTTSGRTANTPYR